MYDRSRYYTAAAIAVIAALIGWFMIKGPGEVKVLKEEADIIVIDRTSDGAAWRDARANVLSRVEHAFGQTFVSGTQIGDGATGFVTILPISADTNNTDVISVLDYDSLSKIRDK